jgi:hypothetical protein
MIKQKLAAWRRLSPSDRNATLEAATIHCATYMLVHTVGLKGWKQTLGRLTRTTNIRPFTEGLREARSALARVSRHTGLNGTCLTRSLTLYWLLRRRGISTDLRLGARQRDNIFQAHAWLEYHGRVINDAADVAEGYAVFPFHPGPDTTSHLKKRNLTSGRGRR